MSRGVARPLEETLTSFCMCLALSLANSVLFTLCAAWVALYKAVVVLLLQF